MGEYADMMIDGFVDNTLAKLSTAARQDTREASPGHASARPTVKQTVIFAARSVADIFGRRRQLQTTPKTSTLQRGRSDEEADVGSVASSDERSA